MDGHGFKECAEGFEWSVLRMRQESEETKHIVGVTEGPSDAEGFHIWQVCQSDCLWQQVKENVIKVV